MGRPRKSRNGSNPSKPSMVDLDDEPKFIELPDDYEEEPVSNGNGCDHGDEAPEENDKVQLKKEKKDKAKTNAKSTLNKPSQADEVKKDVKGTEKSDPPKPEIKNKAESADSQKANNFKNEAKTETKPEAKPVGDCAICDQLATLFCAGCKNVFYCSKEHQKKHWSNHKTRCKDLAKLPYRVQRNRALGRYLVATRDIRPGELIITEPPMIVGPRQLGKPVCLGCHRPLVEVASFRPCSRCTWPVCSQKCQDSAIHDPECRILASCGVKISVERLDQVNMMYASVTVLRALSLQQSNSKLWKEYTKFESHLEERMKTEVYTKVNKEKVVFFIQHYLRLVNKFSDLEILETCGRLDTNCFEIRQDNQNLRALYRIACILSHDCTPNTKHTFNMDNYSLNLYATTSIEKGGIISASYTQPLWPTLKRRDHLFMSKCFWCKCRRCQDPTEFGTNLSDLNCQECGGMIRSSEPLDQSAPWRCEKCHSSMDAVEVKETNERISKEIRALDRSDPEALEKFLINVGTVLPDTHHLVREVQYGIVNLFKIRVSSLLSNAQLLRKSFLCKQLLKVADKIDPGLSRWRGQLLLDLQSSTNILNKRALEEKKISQDQAKVIYHENSDTLNEAIEILKVETDLEDELLQEQKEEMVNLLNNVST